MVLACTKWDTLLGLMVKSGCIGAQSWPAKGGHTVEGEYVTEPQGCSRQTRDGGSKSTTNKQADTSCQPFPKDLSTEAGRLLKITKEATILQEALSVAMHGLEVAQEKVLDLRLWTAEEAVAALAAQEDTWAFTALALATTLFLAKYDKNSEMFGSEYSSLYAKYNMCNSKSEDDGWATTWHEERSGAHLW